MQSDSKSYCRKENYVPAAAAALPVSDSGRQKRYRIGTLDRYDKVASLLVGGR